RHHLERLELDLERQLLDQRQRHPPRQGRAPRQGRRRLHLLGRRDRQQRRPDGDLQQQRPPQRGLRHQPLADRRLRPEDHPSLPPPLPAHGTTWSVWSPTSSASCSTNDNGTRHVKGELRDKDGGVSTYSADVTVNNVAPTATFNNNGPRNEGSDINLSLTGA